MPYIGYMTKNTCCPAFGPIMRRFRHLKNLTQGEVAARLEIAPSYVSRLESTIKKPTVDMLFRIADALEVPASAMIAEMEKERRRA
jgi:transcriptional regulator with XRE-family HTH domain